MRQWVRATSCAPLAGKCPILWSRPSAGGILKDKVAVSGGLARARAKGLAGTSGSETVETETGRFTGFNLALNFGKTGHEPGRQSLDVEQVQ